MNLKKKLLKKKKKKAAKQAPTEKKKKKKPSKILFVSFLGDLSVVTALPCPAGLPGWGRGSAAARSSLLGAAEMCQPNNGEASAAPHRRALHLLPVGALQSKNEPLRCPKDSGRKMYNSILMRSSGIVSPMPSLERTCGGNREAESPIGVPICILYVAIGCNSSV